MKTARLSIPLATAFAAVSSVGLRASAGVSAACAERNGVVAIAAAIGERHRRPREPCRANTPTAAAPMRTMRTSIGHEQDALAPITVGEHPGERRDERGRDEPKQEDDPDGPFAARLYA